MTDLINQPFSRRRFLLSAAATGAIGLAGGSLLTKGANAVGLDANIMSACHWGVFRAQVESGRAVSFTPWEHDKYPSPQLEGVLDSIYSPTRIKYPMVRRAWLENGPGADPDGRGEGDFVRVSWTRLSIS